MNKVKKILILEDDIFTSRVFKSFFEQNGYQVHQSFDIGSAFFKSLSIDFDAAIIDINLPSGSSLEFFDKIKKNIKCPIVICTASSSKEHELVSLKLQADDFVIKSRGVDVLLHRVNRILTSRESQNNKTAENKHETRLYNDCVYNTNLNVIQFRDETINLSNKEGVVIHYLALNINQIVSKDELYYVLYGVSYDGCSRSLDLIVSRLRNKLKNKHLQLEVITKRGRGLLLKTL
ncbi:hypothetical protein CGI23_24950 [Vibrio parahaemolyticus]|uniref:response regulator transcription factor n=1 Tax=Vibrio parahaemolyticus TaxID=670 RepID=UPI00111F7424|nr:response regulator transcription factor [Vibrio parahaemolyticus]TOK17899.1 hypothetical protein CGI23_24950 [Vibrio parahaemolyticus]